MTHERAHPEWQALVDYWLGDMDAATTEIVDEHLLHCDTCGAAFDEVVALARGVRDAFSRGLVPAVLTPGLVERLKAGGRRVREYRVPAGGSVRCSVAPDDELLVSRVGASLRDVRRLDAVLSYSFAPGEEQRLVDLPFDAAAGEVLLAPKLAELRHRPAHDSVLRLLAVDDAGEREIGRYTFHHQAGASAG
ncbi:hypothetical protein [Azohydromonas sp.]|uniref:anti-sigma factor family protein n=1 Tax=Azohydromonas sp. TaxID=1872666 RepID=UPI002C7E075C|nr:hypothetical protein [Azohydromonas sp.]HMM86395.1 hypothetical protein [Azohydromonas sp.]